MVSGDSTCHADAGELQALSISGLSHPLDKLAIRSLSASLRGLVAVLVGGEWLACLVSRGAAIPTALELLWCWWRCCWSTSDNSPLSVASCPPARVLAICPSGLSASAAADSSAPCKRPPRTVQLREDVKCCVKNGLWSMEVFKSGALELSRSDATLNCVLQRKIVIRGALL